MIPRIVHQTAKSKNLTWEENFLIRQNMSRLSGWEYNLWDDEDNRRLMVEHFPEHLARYDSISKGVVRSDIARLAYMHAYGGVYFDTDYKFVNSISEGLLQNGAILGIEYGSVEQNAGEKTFSSNFTLGNAFFAGEKGHPFFSGFIHHILGEGNFQAESDQEILATSGPVGLTKYFVNHQSKYSDTYLAPRMMFFPPPKYRALSFHRNDETVGAHLCWGSWRGKRTAIDVLNRGRRLASACRCAFL